jgi:ketosteroid isomerase-like protein
LGEANVSQRDFDGAVEAYREALGPLLRGDPRPAIEFFSRRDDVTLANPLGLPRLGPAEVDKAIEEAAANFRDGSVRRIEEVARYSTPDLGYVVQIERAEARLPGTESMTPLALRVTMIFRREEDAWKVAHRHADPITTARPISTVIEA